MSGRVVLKMVIFEERVTSSQRRRRFEILGTFCLFGQKKLVELSSGKFQIHRLNIFGKNGWLSPEYIPPVSKFAITPVMFLKTDINSGINFLAIGPAAFLNDQQY